MSEDPSAVLSWPVEAASLPQARWFAEFLNAIWLEQSLLKPGLVQSSVAQALGQPDGRAALVLTLRADVEELKPAIAQARELIQRLSRRGPTEREFARLLNWRAREKSRVDPRKRLIDLWLSDSPEPTRQQILRFARTQLSEDHLLLVQPRAN